MREMLSSKSIERVDELSGIAWNLRALIGSNLIKKYVGNVEWVDIKYNNKVLNENSRKNLLRESDEIQDNEGNILGKLKIYKSQDGIERFTKDNLWISEVKEDIISDFPDWIQKHIKSQKLSIDIPSDIPLVWSRNSIQEREKYTSIIKPHLHRMIIDMILSDSVMKWLKIPMMPEDYLALIDYESRGSSKINQIANRYNLDKNYALSGEEIKLLQDSANTAQFLTLVNFQHNGENTSLRAKKLEDFIQTSFSWVIQDYYWWNFNISYHSNSRWIEIANSDGNWWYGLSFKVDWYHFKSLVENIDNPKTQERIIDIVAHEMTHNEEDKLGIRKWWTHETDENHDESFIKLNRKILTSLIRS